MDSTQLLLLIIIIILTVFLVVIGVQVFFILKELKITLTNLNKVLGDVGEITEKVKHPATFFSALTQGLKTSLAIFESLKRKNKGDSHE